MVFPKFQRSQANCQGRSTLANRIGVTALVLVSILLALTIGNLWLGIPLAIAVAVFVIKKRSCLYHLPSPSAND
ncbi:MAG: hypothetical protein ACP5HZ_04500 [Ferrimicrobium sp.]